MTDKTEAQRLAAELNQWGETREPHAVADLLLQQEAAIKQLREALHRYVRCFPVPVYGTAAEDQAWQLRTINTARAALTATEGL